jgi:hypothetical protein
MKEGHQGRKEGRISRKDKEGRTESHKGRKEGRKEGRKDTKDGRTDGRTGGKKEGRRKAPSEETSWSSLARFAISPYDGR